MDEHAAYAESHIMMDTPDDSAPAPALFARRVPCVASSFLATKEPVEKIGHLASSAAHQERGVFHEGYEAISVAGRQEPGQLSPLKLEIK
jgi:hypothetical protein